MKLENLISIICRANGMHENALSERNSKGQIAYCRMYYYYHAYKTYCYKCAAVGKAINRHHSCVFNGCATYIDLLKTKNENLLTVIENVSKYL